MCYLTLSGSGVWDTENTVLLLTFVQCMRVLRVCVAGVCVCVCVRERECVGESFNLVPVLSSFSSVLPFVWLPTAL